MILSKHAQARTKAFILEQARPLEQALYAHHFEQGGRAAVTTALAGFANDDGGFGHGLEPDIRTPESTVIATTVALQILRELRAPAQHPLVLGAMGYLLEHYDHGLTAWPIINASVARAPHAPWWEFDQDLATRWRGFLANPRAEIVGYLHDYPDLAPPGLRALLTAEVMAFLDTGSDQMTANDLECYLRLVESESLPDALRSVLVDRLTPIVDRLVSRDPSTWSTYVLKPLQVAGSPQSPFAGMLKDAVQANLDWEIGRLGEDGAWEPNWSWFGAFPEAWPLAEREWKGVLTVKVLKWLRNYGRLA